MLYIFFDYAERFSFKSQVKESVFVTVCIINITMIRIASKSPVCSKEIHSFIFFFLDHVFSTA